MLGGSFRLAKYSDDPCFEKENGSLEHLKPCLGRLLWGCHTDTNSGNCQEGCGVPIRASSCAHLSLPWKAYY
jgi:hypothetical protein